MTDPLRRFFGRPRAAPDRRTPSARRAAARRLATAFPALTVYPESVCAVPGGLVVAARDGGRRKVIACGRLKGWAGPRVQVGDVPAAAVDATPANMRKLRQLIPWLRPQLPGLRPSAGLGDRLGLGTPGHIAAGAGSGLFLVLAQQSIREMARTGRAPQQVLDEAAFGVFQCGYEEGYGADADHLKKPADVDRTAAAGFTYFTLDPSDYVDDSVGAARSDELAAKFGKLAADGVPGARSWRKRYLGRSFKVGALKIVFDERTLLRAGVKYGRAVAFAETMARRVARRARRHELELSVDETNLPTSAEEHFFIVNELRERGVKLHALAPRFAGDFEKGVDYRDDLRGFEEHLRQHVEIAGHCGPYKISVHSGSDKFSLYPILARVTGGLFHLKTAGTSYLEALRVVARFEPGLMRELISFCRQRYQEDRRTYHVSALLAQAPPAARLPDEALEASYLDTDAGRQIMHVTFGSVLLAQRHGRPRFRDRLLALLLREADTYTALLEAHLGRHLEGLKSSHRVI